MKVLVINASIRGDQSISRALSDQLAQKFKANGHRISERDLSQHMLFVSAQSFAGASTAVNERTPDQADNQALQLADQLIDELQAADILIIGTPVYNFGPPGNLKAWADLVARAGTTFDYTENGPKGLLTVQKAHILAASGGTKIGSEIDFMSPWLVHFLGFLGIDRVEITAADRIFGVDGEEKIQAAKAAVEAIEIPHRPEPAIPE